MYSSTPVTGIDRFNAAIIPQAVEDPHYGVRDAYRADTSENKVDVVIGIYRDDRAQPWILPVVRKVEQLITFWFHLPLT
jgi:aspartate/tyrosine/aromatic aminotransferase